MTLTSKDRVLAVLNHEVPDRVPIVIGVSNATGIKMKTYREIKAIAGIDAPDEYIYDWPELGTAKIDEVTMMRLHSDVRGVRDSHPAKTLKRNQTREPHSPFVDSWGSGQKEIGPGEWFPGIHPLAKAETIEEIDEYANWPDMSDPTRIAHVKAAARELADQNEYAILATPWLLFPLERAFAMQKFVDVSRYVQGNPETNSCRLHSIY